MTGPWQVFPITGAIKKNLQKKLETQSEIVSFSEAPHLASLVACLGLQSELGNKALDRLSAPLNIQLEDFLENPWQTEIVSYGNKIGVRAWIDNVHEFYPDHPDFVKILHPLSIDHQGKLNQIVIFPQDVADNYKTMGLELVVVRDWALTSFFAPKNQQVNYFRTNEWEIKSNCARLQARMMPKNQVAFIGTHDLADHLLGGNGKILAEKREVFQEVHRCYQNLFNCDSRPKNILLVVSYLIGVILDDMAQPKWYRSQIHGHLLQRSLFLLKSLKNSNRNSPDLNLQKSFHNLMAVLRRKVPVSLKTIDQYLSIFDTDLA